MVLRDGEDEQNYCRLGFTPGEMNLKLRVGRVELKALDYRLGGIAIFFLASGRTRQPGSRSGYLTGCLRKWLLA
jgi:hypothetical protein